MKNFLLKTLDVLLTVVMVASAVYATFNLVMAFLPEDIQSVVYEWLRISQEKIAATSISAVINAAVLTGSKIVQTYSKVKLSTELARAKQVNNQTTEVNTVVVERANRMISNQQIIQEQLKALLAVQKVNAERNIKASDKLVYETEKDAYRQAVELIDKAQQQMENIKNITTVFEKTEIKEVLVEKLTDHLSGRV